MSSAELAAHLVGLSEDEVAAIVVWLCDRYPELELDAVRVVVIATRQNWN